MGKPRLACPRQRLSSERSQQSIKRRRLTCKLWEASSPEFHAVSLLKLVKPSVLSQECENVGMLAVWTAARTQARAPPTAQLWLL